MYNKLQFFLFYLFAYKICKKKKKCFTFLDNMADPFHPDYCFP